MSIQAIDLRIGNFVKDSGGKILRIDWFGRDKIYMKMEIMGTEVHPLTEYFEELQPIPLTPQLLEKCGFENMGHFTVAGIMNKDIGRNRVLSIGNVGTPNEILYIEEVKNKVVEDLICIHNYDFDGYLSLHQLQNIYYFLVHEELKIKPLNNG